MAKRNDNIAPFDRRETRKWTRVSDYWPDGGSASDAVLSNSSRSFSDFGVSRHADRVPPSKRRLTLPAIFVAAAAILLVWAGGLFDRTGPQPAAAATTSKGLVFGLCSDGGLTNCVAAGDSFYLGGKNVRIAGIEAPQLYGAACPKEAALGQNAAVKLQGLLNSGELEMTKVAQDLDRFGLLLRNVSVEGNDVGRAMVREGLARNIGDISRSWC